MDNMTINFFQFDWIFIDTVIIILLILFLVSVKILKERFRWRSKLSNTALYQYKFDKKSLELINQNHLIKRISITRNNILKNKRNPLPIIILIRVREKRNLFNILTEGLASYGFEIINIKFKKNIFKSYEYLNLENQRNILYLLSDLMNELNKHQLISALMYYTITFYNSFFLNNLIISDANNVGMILIDPKFDSQIQNNLSEIITNKKLIEKIFFIFCKKSNLFSINKNLQEFLRKFPFYEENNHNLSILERCKKSFKFYETILLGLIINVIESSVKK